MKHDPLTTITNEALAAACRRLRTDLGLSLRDVATAARGHGYALTFGGLGELELCKRCWSSWMVEAVSAGLGVSTAAFLRSAAAHVDHGGDPPMIAPSGPPGKKRSAAA